MSSLLQFRGQISRKGVRLEAYLIRKVWVPVGTEGVGYTSNKYVEEVDCPDCGRKHPKLYGFWRKPAGMLGHWVVFRINGEEHVPDLSIPMGLEKMPRDAVELPLSEWHRE